MHAYGWEKLFRAGGYSHVDRVMFGIRMLIYVMMANLFMLMLLFLLVAFKN